MILFGTAQVETVQSGWTDLFLNNVAGMSQS